MIRSLAASSSRLSLSLSARGQDTRAPLFFSAAVVCTRNKLLPQRERRWGRRNWMLFLCASASAWSAFVPGGEEFRSVKMKLISHTLTKKCSDYAAGPAKPIAKKPSRKSFFLSFSLGKQEISMNIKFAQNEVALKTAVIKMYKIFCFEA
jgi:hypothetical protein